MCVSACVCACVCASPLCDPKRLTWQQYDQLAQWKWNNKVHTSHTHTHNVFKWYIQTKHITGSKEVQNGVI